jgi:hypothetical protein
MDWKRGVVAGLVAGILWGWLAMAVNSFTGAFPLWEGLLFNLTTFAIGGAVFGIVVGGFLVIARDILPFRSLLPKAVMVSVCLWVVLRIGGTLLSGIAPWRYHTVLTQTVQGFFLAILMGLLLGVLWKKLIKDA